MSSGGHTPRDTERILILAPFGRDGALAREVLEASGMKGEVCGSIDHFCDKLLDGAGAAILTEEVLTPAALESLEAILSREPPWSDFPFIMLGDPDGAARREEKLARIANVTILERPLRRRTFLAAVRAAIRARRKQYDARRAIRDRDEFLAMLGHELRNPLGAILFATQLSGRDGVSEATMRKQRDVIDRQTRRLARLVDDLLDVSRVTSGKVQLQLAPVDLVEVLRRSAESIAELATSAQIHVSLRHGPAPVIVTADALRLEQVFTNLLTNAVKYTPAGGEVDVAIAVQGGRAVVRVKDTGVGLPPEALGRIFELFAQVQTTLDRARGGMGIGLTLVKSLVELHAGTVKAFSEGIGKGTEFLVDLPIGGAALSPEAKAPEVRAPVSTSARRIVLVEDNDDVRDSFRTLLEQGGHQVEEARDGQEGLEKILAFEPFVAIVDIGLPLMDGYEVARRVRQRLGSEPFLVALSGYGQPDDRKRAKAAGFDEHVTKPVDYREIETLLATRTGS